MFEFENSQTKYFQNGLAELVEIRRTVRSVDILSIDIFFNFLTSFTYFEDIRLT
jgi:hypothetical protein